MLNPNTLNLHKSNLLVRADHEFELFRDAYKKSMLKLAHKHITNAFKLKAVCAYSTSTSNPREKTRLYLEASRLATIAGDSNRSRALVIFSKDLGLTTKDYRKLHHLATSKYPCEYNDNKLMDLYNSEGLYNHINIGDVFLLDKTCCRVAFVKPEDSRQDSYIVVKSEYAICISNKLYDKSVFYLISAGKFICETHVYIRFHGIDVSADFNFMPSESPTSDFAFVPLEGIDEY